MADKIHKNLDEAKKAISDFRIALEKLQEEFGAFEFNGEWNGEAHYVVQYYDVSGNVKHYG